MTNPGAKARMSRSVAALTCPDAKDPPTESPQCTGLSSVTAAVRVDLLGPEARIAAGRNTPVFAAVAVPEAAMHEDDGQPPRQNDVRCSGHAVYVDAKTKAICMQKAPNQHFGGCILPPHATHQGRSPGGGHQSGGCAHVGNDGPIDFGSDHESRHRSWIWWPSLAVPLSQRHPLEGRVLDGAARPSV